jgi:hypothetical protein
MMTQSVLAFRDERMGCGIDILIVGLGLYNSGWTCPQAVNRFGTTFGKHSYLNAIAGLHRDGAGKVPVLN